MEAIHYVVHPADLHGHYFSVLLTITDPVPGQTVSLPVWIPGSYLVREFSRHLCSLEASQNGQVVSVQALSKNTWQIACQSPDAGALQLSYRVYAFDNSVRAAWLDSARGFFNPTSLCLRVHGQEERPHGLTLREPVARSHWQVATALQPVDVDAQGFGSYVAVDYDELVDSPVEMGSFWRGRFDVLGIPHEFVVAGALPSFDSERLLADTQAICEIAMRFWHPEIKDDARGVVPHDRYVFMLNAVGNGYGGLEHRHSTALICKRSDLPSYAGVKTEESKLKEGYRTLLGLISHEYFHTWNVKRLRPSELARYDYEQENYTYMLWFFEGFTSYYDDLLLRRAERIDDGAYLHLLGKTLFQVIQTPGRTVQSVAEASFDAWVKYYRQDENTANATVSYYTKGALVALCLDLCLRQEGAATLDAVMRQLWNNSRGGPISEADVLAVLKQLSGRSWQREIDDWVHGRDELPVVELLKRAGIAVEFQAATWEQRLGILVEEGAGRIMVRRIQRLSPAERASMAVGDEWLGVRLRRLADEITSDASITEETGAWRLYKLSELDDLLPSPQGEHVLEVLVARDARLLWCVLDAPSAQSCLGEPRLRIADSEAAYDWLLSRS